MLSRLGSESGQGYPSPAHQPAWWGLREGSGSRVFKTYQGARGDAKKLGLSQACSPSPCNLGQPPDPSGSVSLLLRDVRRWLRPLHSFRILGQPATALTLPVSRDETESAAGRGVRCRWRKGRLRKHRDQGGVGTGQREVGGLRSLDPLQGRSGPRVCGWGWSQEGGWVPDGLGASLALPMK